MTQLLETSFLGLPSDRHRHMFLDAAIMLRGQPLQDLRFAWIAMVQSDDDLGAQLDIAACAVSDCLAELVASSLISITDEVPRRRGWAYDPLRHGKLPPHPTARCVITT